MTDDEAFIAAICAAPRDDLPRLVYADWLDDHDQPERAEFIRVQCRLAELAEEVKALSVYAGANVNLSLLRDWKGRPVTDEQRARCEEALTLMRRALELYRTHWGTWAEGLPDWLTEDDCQSCLEQAPDYETNVVECRRCDSTGRVPCDDLIDFRRGFVAELDLTWEQARDHLDAIRKAHPIEKVVLTGDRPVVNWEDVGEQVFLEGDDVRFQRSTIPRDVIRSGAILKHLLGRRWPGIEWELSPVDQYDGWRQFPNESGGIDHVRVEQAPNQRDQIEAAVRREMPAGERVEWLGVPSPSTVRDHLYYTVAHVCPENEYRGGLPPVAILPRRNGVYRMIEMALRRFSPRAGSLDVPVYVGRCERCRTTYLAPQR